MNIIEWPTTSSGNCDSSYEEILVKFDAFIVACARKVVHENSKNLSPDVLYRMKEEVAQNTRIKLWLALQKRQIEYIKAYICRIVYHEYISIVRQNSPFVQMLTNENWENLQESVMVTLSETMHDPAYVFEQDIAVNECMAEVVDAVLLLYPCQRRAMICTLEEKIDDPNRLKEAFRARGIDIDTLS